MACRLSQNSNRSHPEFLAYVVSGIIRASKRVVVAISQGAVDLNDHTRKYVVSLTRPSRLRETISTSLSTEETEKGREQSPFFTVRNKVRIRKIPERVGNSLSLRGYNYTDNRFLEFLDQGPYCRHRSCPHKEA